ncbi:trypco2 family protein [Streptomyces asiaticus]|uniref:trypco2 family protein n=1 Tax=Streptomyces asiaticus TaxID=114695 RepID=UPI001BA8433B|nr:trypco2 family protein [Streptomyces asiaticus]
MIADVSGRGVCFTEVLELFVRDESARTHRGGPRQTAAAGDRFMFSDYLTSTQSRRYALPSGGHAAPASKRGSVHGGTMGQDLEGVELAKAVQWLRDELLEAAAQGASRAVRFAVDAIELEFTVELRKDRKGKAGFKAWVVTAGADVSRGRADTHRVKLALSPKDPEGRTLEIGNTDRGGTAGFTRAAPSSGGGS